VKLDRDVRPLGHEVAGERAHRRVAAVAVDDEHAAETGAAEGGDRVAHHGEERFHAQGDRAGKGGEIGCDTERHHREDGHAERLGGLGRHALGEDEVDAERQLGVLLGRADGKDAAVVGLQVSLDLHPVHVGDAHGVGSRRRRGFPSPLARRIRGGGGSAWRAGRE
jgi:hypothetical protein